MSEKQFDHIENRIREAAENSEPAFDEYAWTLMEARLDKEDNKRRPILIWWGLLIFLIIVVGGLYFSYNNKPSAIRTLQQVAPIIAEKKSVPQKSIPSATTQPSIDPGGNIDPAISLNKKAGPGEVVITRILSDKNFVTRQPNDIPGKKGRKTKGKISK